jgi:hypothetical protein
MVHHHIFTVLYKDFENELKEINFTTLNRSCMYVSALNFEAYDIHTSWHNQ